MPTLIWLAKSIGVYGLIAAAVFAWHLYDRNQAYHAGQRDERLVWQEQARRAELQREADRKVAQSKIDQAERDYLSRTMTDAIRISELEKALEEDQTSSPVAGCGPALSRKLRDAIDRVGRD